MVRNKSSGVKRERRRERFTVALAPEERVEEEELTAMEEEEEREMKLEAVESIWNESIESSLLQKAQPQQLEFEEEEVEEVPFASIEEEEEQKEEEEEEEEEEKKVTERKGRPQVKKLTDADIKFTTLAMPDDFQFQSLSYVDTNGAADSFFYHNLWWTQAASLESLIIQNPRRLESRGDTQFEAMIRVATLAPKFIMRNDPRNLQLGMKRRVDQNMQDMVEIAHDAHERVRRRIQERPFTTDGVRLLKMGTTLDRKTLTKLRDYNRPQLVHSSDRSFLLSLDKRLSRLPHDVQRAFTKDEAIERLFRFIDEMSLLTYVDEFVLDPSFIPASEHPDLTFRSRWRRHWRRLLRLQDRDKEEQQLIDLDALSQDSAWSAVTSELRQASGNIDGELWESIVFTAATTGSIPWSGAGWIQKDSELLLSYMEMILSILQLYNDVIESIIRDVQNDIEVGLLAEEKEEREIQKRVSARVRPFVIALRLQDYAVSQDELLSEVVLNAYYGVERDAAGTVSQITQEAVDSGTESLRLLPRFQFSAEFIDRATTAGESSFDVRNYSAGSYNYIDKVMISKAQAEILGSSGLDKKVLDFRNQLVAALKRYRQVTKRPAFMEDEELPSLTGHDINFILCAVATYIHSARVADIEAALRAAVTALSRSEAESRRSKRVSEFLLYYALAVKLFLFEDGYMEVPRKQPAKALSRQQTIRKELSKFIEMEAEEEETEEGEEQQEETDFISLEERRALMEKRLLRVASELYTPNNQLSRLDASEQPLKDLTITAARIMKIKFYNRGLSVIDQLREQELLKYKDVWLTIEDNAQRMASGTWVVTAEIEDGSQAEFELQGTQIVQSIPAVRDIQTVAELTQRSLRNSFYSAVSVRELLERGRKALPDAPNQLSTAYPLIVTDSPDSVDIKERTMQVVQQFLVSGYLIPSNVDSLAAALTIVQLMRLLRDNASEDMAASEMIFIVTRLLQPAFTPTLSLQQTEQRQIACRLMLACTSGNADVFRDLLYYASIQDIRVAGLLALQIDYWLAAEDAKPLTDDIRTDIVHQLVIELLERKTENIESYNAAVDTLNETIRDRGSSDTQLPLLRAVNAAGAFDIIKEADYGSITLDDANILSQLRSDSASIFYTPWLSIQQSLRLYSQYIDSRDAGKLCEFIDTAAGRALSMNYIRTDCGREVVIDVRKDDILNRQTFRLLEKHSLLYDGEDYDSRLEAVIAYFAMTADTLFFLDKFRKSEFDGLSMNQKKLWTKVADAAADDLTSNPTKDKGAVLEDAISDLNKVEQRSFTSILEAMTQSSMRDLKIDVDGKLHQSRPGKSRPYTGYVFIHDKTDADGAVFRVYTPVYPKYRRMLKRLLSEVKKTDSHWLDNWSAQYRPRVFVQMKKKEQVWKPFARNVESALTLKDLIGDTLFQDMKELFKEPPIRPAKKVTEFYGFGRGSNNPAVRELREIMLLIAHLMQIPQQFASLAMLLFVVPDARTATAYDPIQFMEAVTVMQEVAVVANVAPSGVTSYIEATTSEAAAQDVLVYVEEVRRLFKDAQLQLEAGNVTRDVRTVALMFGVRATDETLLQDIENGLEGLDELEAFITALRYPFTNPGRFSINQMIEEISSGEQAVEVIGDDVFSAAFLAKKSSMVIPGPMRAKQRAAPRTEQKQQPKRRKIIVEEEEEEQPVSPAIQELLQSLAEAEQEEIFAGRELDVTRT